MQKKRVGMREHRGYFMFEVGHKVWYVGKCKKCGSNIYEMPCSPGDLEETKFADYKNACSNAECEESYWHYVGDQEFADYYEHV